MVYNESDYQIGETSEVNMSKSWSKREGFRQEKEVISLPGTFCLAKRLEKNRKRFMLKS